MLVNHIPHTEELQPSISIWYMSKWLIVFITNGNLFIWNSLDLFTILDVEHQSFWALGRCTSTFLLKTINSMIFLFIIPLDGAFLCNGTSCDGCNVLVLLFMHLFFFTACLITNCHIINSLCRDFLFEESPGTFLLSLVYSNRHPLFIKPLIASFS